MHEKRFCTVINCMDGRTQLPVNAYLQERFGAGFVDTITEAGPARVLADELGSPLAGAIHGRVGISVGAHGSNAVALVAHHDCAGNPVSEVEQKAQLARALDHLDEVYPRAELIGIWVGAEWTVDEVEIRPPRDPS